MPQSDQGATNDRYAVIPRVAIFLRREDSFLLLKGAPTKRLWANKYNGLGGHVERGEDALFAAKRELLEETGELDALLVPVGGGGLAAGSATVAKGLYPQLRVIGIEPEAGDDTRRSLAAGRRVSRPRRWRSAAPAAGRRSAPRGAASRRSAPARPSPR